MTIFGNSPMFTISSILTMLSTERREVSHAPVEQLPLKTCRMEAKAYIPKRQVIAIAAKTPGR